MKKRYEILHNPQRYIESFLQIKTKGNRIVPLRLNSTQRRLYQTIAGLEREGKPIRVIILKSRQMGFSTLTEALLYYRTATKRNVNSLIITHKDEATTNLFRMSKLFQERNPLRPMLKASNAKELLFENPTKNVREKARQPGLHSKLKCATAGGKGVGRSDTLTNVHASELAFWPGNVAETYAGLLQAVPNTPESMIVIESTANGFNFFKELWDNAVAGETDFVPFFAPWYEMEEYRMAYHGEELTEEETELQKAFGLDAEQLMWRRWCLRNNCNNNRDLFRQEYPATPEEAFLATGTCVFDSRAILLQMRWLEQKEKREKETREGRSRCGRFVFTENWEGLQKIVLQDCHFQEVPQGEIVLFQEPIPGRPYTIGGDTAGEGSDYFTAQVIDNITGEQMARLRWQRCDEDTYAKQVYCLGMYYQTALLAIEVNFSTHPQKVLEYLQYPKLYVREVFDTYTGQMRQSFGFRTDGLTRPVLIAQLTEFFRDYVRLVRDRETLEECLTFVRTAKGRAEAEAGKHDDLVMAYGIALLARGQQRMTEERRLESGEASAKWTADQWEDYRNADSKGRAYLREKWGEPK